MSEFSLFRSKGIIRLIHSALTVIFFLSSLYLVYHLKSPRLKTEKNTACRKDCSLLLQSPLKDFYLRRKIEQRNMRNLNFITVFSASSLISQNHPPLIPSTCHFCNCMYNEWEASAANIFFQDHISMSKLMKIFNHTPWAMLYCPDSLGAAISSSMLWHFLS